MLSLVYQSLAYAISEELNISSSEVQPLLEIPKNSSRGDVALPCFKLAKRLSLSPQEISQKISEAVCNSKFCLSAEATGPFVNIVLDYEQFFIKLLEGAERTVVSSGKILLEYSSPNIAKPFHVGHLRATLIGGSLDRILKHSGSEVVSVNHLGDWGTQFGFVWAGSEIWGNPQEESVSALVEIYRKATSLKEEQEKGEAEDKPDINQMARDYFLKLEQGEKEAVNFWKWCSEISLKYLKATYTRLGISFDHYIGESFYAPMFGEIKSDLEKAKALEDSDGALGVDLGEDLGFARITTEDGRSLYLARDIAAVKYRTDKFKPSESWYVVGSAQSLHFRQLNEISRKLYNTEIEHIDFGMVLGMKTRGSGSFIELNDFLDEAQSYALEAYRSQVEKRPEEADENEVARCVALAAIIYSTLSRGRNKDVNFSWKEALSFTGETGPYLLYAYARICSVEKRSGISLPADYSPEFELLSDDNSKKLLFALLNFERFLNFAIKDREPMHIASYATMLAKEFSSVYRDLRVVGAEPELASARLCLFSAVRRQLGTCLDLLGIPSLEQM